MSESDIFKKENLLKEISQQAGLTPKYIVMTCDYCTLFTGSRRAMKIWIKFIVTEIAIDIYSEK